jgi:hypothetical protein
MDLVEAYLRDQGRADLAERAELFVRVGYDDKKGTYYIGNWPFATVPEPTDAVLRAVSSGSLAWVSEKKGLLRITASPARLMALFTALVQATGLAATQEEAELWVLNASRPK